jgi:hypothetical protein
VRRKKTRSPWKSPWEDSKKNITSTKNGLPPRIYIKVTDNWIEFSLRYAVEVRQRRIVHNRLTTAILEAIEKSPAIKIASATLSIATSSDIGGRI